MLKLAKNKFFVTNLSSLPKCNSCKMYVRNGNGMGVALVPMRAPETVRMDRVGVIGTQCLSPVCYRLPIQCTSRLSSTLRVTCRVTVRGHIATSVTLTPIGEKAARNTQKIEMVT